MVHVWTGGVFNVLFALDVCSECAHPFSTLSFWWQVRTWSRAPGIFIASCGTRYTCTSSELFGGFEGEEIWLVKCEDLAQEWR